jgi:photosystem II stability/assembly factor-like uncharacterized protein
LAGDTLTIVIRSDDGGATWTVVDEQPLKLEGVHFVDRMRGWTVGERGLVRHSADGGLSWTSQRVLADAEDLRAVAFMSPTVGVAVGTMVRAILPMLDAAPYVLRTVDGGQTWTPVVLPPSATARSPSILTGVCLLPDGRGFALGSNPGGEIALVTTDGGATWSDVTTRVFAGGVGVGAIACAPSGDLWAVGRSVVHSPDGGATWEDRSAPVRALLEDALAAVAFATEDHGSVVSGTARDLGGGEVAQPVVLLTRDGGTSWSEAVLPFTPVPASERRAALVVVAFADTQGVALGEDSPIAGDFGPLGFYTHDGLSWERATFPPGVGFIVSATIVP